MDPIHTIERFGELTKEEPLSRLENEMIMADTLVLEAVNPYFGYYHDAPMTERKPYLYFVLDDCHCLQSVSRAVVDIRKRTTYPFCADMGCVVVNREKWPVLRICEIDKYTLIGDLQEMFSGKGIGMMRYRKSFSTQMCLIRLQKFFFFQEVEHMLFLDARDPNKAYFQAPYYVSWDAFKEITTEAKYDTSILYFDAAQALFYENRNMFDLVRIYREHLSVDKLRAIRERYLKVYEVYGSEA